MNNRMNNEGHCLIGLPRKGRTLLAAAVLAAMSGLCGLSDQAKAVGIVITGDNTSFVPLTSFNPAPNPGAVNTIFTTGGSVPNTNLSPFFGTPENGNQYTAVLRGGSATYNFANPETMLQLFWGSPDAFNTITFFNGLNGTGGAIASFTGSALVPFGATLSTGHDLVSFLDNGGTFQSITIASSDFAFEFSNLAASTPLPAALPLYAAGIGVMGLLGWRRKRKQEAAALA
jgi:hypothetical protein